jgi:hypothetical protein
MGGLDKHHSLFGDRTAQCMQSRKPGEKPDDDFSIVEGQFWSRQSDLNR